MVCQSHEWGSRFSWLWLPAAVPCASQLRLEATATSLCVVQLGFAVTAELAAGGVDFASLSLAKFHIHAARLKHLPELADRCCVGSLIGQAGNRVVRYHIQQCGASAKQHSQLLRMRWRIITVNKPSNAINGIITLDAYDADFMEEGELIINGNAAIVLFGADGISANDAASADITISTPASYWRDGNNTLLFRHTRSGGYIIDAVTVQFEVDTTVNTEGTVSSKSLPIDLTGATPEESSITVTVNKPSNAINGIITLDAYDADFMEEGELIINGNAAIVLFGADGISANDAASADITISTPASYWRDGNNTLLFRHTRSGGYIIDAVTVQFEVDTTVNTEGTVSSKSLPVDLTGATPEESSITVTVNKPSNAINGIITLDAYDADFMEEGELIINGNPAITLFGADGISTNDAASADITISTPASYWRDGNNTLLFRHTRTGGYIIDAVTVQFEVDTTVNTESTVSSKSLPVDLTGATPEGTVSSGSLPVDLTGATPEESSITVTLNKPTNATNGLITLDAYDADFMEEGELIINGNAAIVLFGADGISANDAASADITISTPASYWRDGNNTLLFRHTRSGGYIIDAVTVQFEVSANANQTGSSSVSLSWVAPAERADNTGLSLSEISGYAVYYGTSAGNYTNSLSINDSSATSVTVSDLPVGTYYMVMTTRDTDGRESEYSSVIAMQTK